MSRAEWELIEMARARALADRYERESLESAVAHGCEGVQAQQAYALGWLAMRCADRQVRLEADAATGRVLTQARDRIEELRVERQRLKRAAWEIAALDQEIAHGAALHALDDALAALPTLTLIGGNAEQQHATGVPKDAARAHDAASPATPPPPRPQGVAGHPPARESRK